MLTNNNIKRYESSSSHHYVRHTMENSSKSWNGTNDDTSSADSDDESHRGTLRNRILALKKRFHQDRKLIVKHLPRNVVKHEITQLLSDFTIDLIQLNSNDDKSSTATVSLRNPETLDEWNSDRTFLLRGQSVSVAPTPTEMVLCVAKLPFHFAETNFYDLIKSYGDVKMFFLMISEKTGKSKGYGFVQFASKEYALAARNGLNDKMVDGCQLVCDWLDSSHLSFKSLHSTCLYVDRLPRQFRDMGEFRTIFEKIVRPPYCQIALRNGCPLDWGLVEYLSPDDAELAQASCNNYRLRNQSIRVVFFIPGVRAITLMLNLLDTPTSRATKSTGLLPDPTGQSIRASIENLSKQNPIFAENLKNIIIHQIQESKHLKENRDEIKPNSLNLKPVETNNIEGGTVLKQSNKEIEKIIPPTPPMTPTIVNSLPIITSAATVPAPPTSVALLSNATLPPAGPAVMDKIQFIKEKPYPPPITVWTADVIGPSISNSNISTAAAAAAFSPIVSPLVTGGDSTPATFAVRPPPNSVPAANLVQEVMNLPLNVQQNILNLINNSAAAANVSLSPAIAPVSVPPTISPFSPLSAVDPNWILASKRQSEPATSLVKTPIVPPPLFTAVPAVVVSKAIMRPNSWRTPIFMTPAAAACVPTAIFNEPPTPQSIRSIHHLPGATANGVIGSQPSTPVLHHHLYYSGAAIGGQKRKLLPSPEKSPEGNYIGQHSQGIGGHYADSYFKKKKMF